MFTGLVEGCGTVAGLQVEGPGLRLSIALPDEMFAGEQSAAAMGDSVAINGCCLTVVGLSGNQLDFQAGEETLNKTNLGQLKVGDQVNLERSLPVDGRLGGHFVQGHVDGVGVVDAIDRDGEWVFMWFRIPPDLLQLLVPKGSVAVDGISLTVVEVESQRFNVALIPHTLEVTTLGRRAVGQSVNIETDILGKYVARLLGQGASGGA